MKAVKEIKNLEEFIINRIMDTEIKKPAIIAAAKESSKKLLNLPKLKQTRILSNKLKK